MTVPYNDKKDNPLNWWKINKGQFPSFLELARDFLAILVMSTPSELPFMLMDTSVIRGLA